MEEVSTRRGSTLSLPQVWRDYFAFLSHPKLPKRGHGFNLRSIKSVASLSALDILIGAIFVGMAYAAEWAGIDLPEIDWDIDLWLLFLLGVAAAPLVEEVVFRGWLTGRRAAVLCLTSPLLLLLVLALVRLIAGPLAIPALVGIVAVWAFATTVLAAHWWNSPGVSERYARLFPWFFWASCGLFAFGHVFNFEDGVRPLLVLMVIPQFVGGTILGFARLHYGMWSSIAMHAVFNALFFALAWATGELN